MINQLVSYLLDKIIGKYVDNFSSLNVKTGLFKGDIQLENLPLKQSVLEDLCQWPIAVKSGLIGRVTLRIPYTRFRSQAWAIAIEDVYIVAGPKGSWKLSEKTAENEQLMRKLLLDSFEAKWRKRMQLQANNAKAESRIWLSYVASLGYRILRNIQIELRNVHVRYEDDLTIPGHRFSTGLVIDELSTKSSDFQWECKGELKDDLDLVHKQVDLIGISVYLESRCQGFCVDVTAHNIKSLLRNKVSQLVESDYIVKPICLHGNMTRNISAFPMNQMPRISLQLKMDLVEVSLSQAQYKAALALSNEIERVDRQKYHIKYRPHLSVKESPRHWWKFAITEHIRHVFHGAALRERARHLVRYVQSYEDYFLNNDSVNELDFRNQFESELDLDCLIRLREVAMERVCRRNRDSVQEKVVKEPQTQQGGWWDYVWGRKTKEATRELPIETPLVSETSQILEKILPLESNNAEGLEQDISAMLDEVDTEAVNFFTRDQIFLRGEFTLEGIRLNLFKDHDIPLVGIKASNLVAGFELRPQYSSWRIQLGLGSLFVQDLRPENRGCFSEVVSSIGHTKWKGAEMFSLMFETNPLPNTCSPSIKRILAITSEPLTIVHCPMLMESVTDYFSSVRSAKDFKATAEKHILYARDRTSASIRNIFNKGPSDIRWWVSLNISAPKIVFPNYLNSSTYVSSNSCVLLDLGRLQVTNCSNRFMGSWMNESKSTVDMSNESDAESENFLTPASSPFGSLENLCDQKYNYNQDECSDNEDEVEQQREHQEVHNLYDDYSIRLDNVMALVGTWDKLQSISSSCTHKNKSLLLMEPFNLQLTLKQKCIRTKSDQLPYLVLESTLSRLLINISDRKLQTAKGCLMTLACFRNNSPISDSSSIKQKRTVRTDHPTMSKNESFKSVSVSFVLQSFIVQLESQERPLAELSLTEARFELARYPSTTLIKVQLLNLILADARANLGPKLDFILASHKCVNIEKSTHQENADPIIEFGYEISFDVGSQSVKHKTSLVFSDLDVIANQETLTELLSFVRPLFAEDSSSLNEVKHESSSIAKSDSFDVYVICKAVSILLIRISSKSDSENRFAESVGKIYLSNLNLEMHRNGAALSTTIRVRSVNVEDISTPDSLHRNIFTLTAGPSDENMKNSECIDIVNINIVQKGNGTPLSIHGSMPHMVYVHSPQFVHSVEMCISEFRKYFARLKNNLAAVARTAILSSKKNENFGFLSNASLSLEMLSPVLVLPRYKSSNEIILVNLGDIEVVNSSGALEIAFTDAVVISKDLQILDGGYDISVCTDNNAKFPLVDKIDLNLKISRSTDTPRILIECAFSSSLCLSFSKQSYEQVLKSLDNLVYDEDESQPGSDFNEDNIEDDDGLVFLIAKEFVEEDPHIDIPITLLSKFSQIKMELYPDSFENYEDPMLRLTFQGISFEFDRTNKYIKDIELIVDQISMYQVLDSRQHKIQKLLIYSQSSLESSSSNFEEKSASCPDLLEEHVNHHSMDSLPSKQSLPYTFSKLKKSLSEREELNTFIDLSKSKAIHKSNKPEKLAKIHIRLIDKKIPSFTTEYDSTNRFINADFNQLTFRITMEAWVILLDFFGLGSKFYDPKDLKDLSDVSKVLPSFNRRYDGEIEEIINTRFNVHLNMFSLILENETRYLNHSNLAEISTRDFDLQTISKDGNLNLSGSLNDFELTDLSPTGNLYSSRLFPASNQVQIIEFNLFKYGLPDPGLLRDEDMRLSVKISAPIVYVHTQRFLQELNQFFQNFLQYQDRLSHLRVISAGRIVDKSAQRASRINMRVSCQAPLLLLPVSAFSDQMLVIDLGKLSLNNEFKVVDNGSSHCLLDEMRIDLHDMDVYSAVRVHDPGLGSESDLVFPHLTIRPINPKPLSRKCNLNLTVRRNLNSNISHSSPDWEIYGILSSVVFSLNVDQYRTIRGVLAHNLGENVDHLKSYKFQAYQMDPLLHTDLTGISWLAMRMEVCLEDVQLNLMSPLHSLSDSEEQFTLCRLNFFQSKLIYESYSDASKMITLACQQITVEDLRFVSCPANNRLNVFQTIISSDQSNHTEQDPANSSQLHIAYSSNSDHNTFVLKLNRMKAITIFDWLQITKNWIFTPPYEIISLATEDEKRFDKHVALYMESNPEYSSVSPQPLTMRKHYQDIIQEEFKPTEITFEVQESRFFILENSSHLHTHALILILAGTCSYQTRENRPGPFSFSVSQFHLASCAMSSDTSSLLSIINPVELRIKSEEKLFVTHGKPSLENVLQDKDSTKLKIDVAVSAFQIRLSFTDIQLLAKIVQSFQNQTTPPANVAYQADPVRRRWSSLNKDNYSSLRTVRASLTPVQRLSKFVDTISIHHLEDHEFVSICLIDDCVDADVPLFDIKLNNVTMDLELGITRGTFKALLSVEYYNTNSFGWTPVIEPWPFSMQWCWLSSTMLTFKSGKTLNVDISSHLLQISRNTHSKWCTELQQNRIISSDYSKRHHNRFDPFIVVNELGCPIKYRILSLNKPPMYNEIWSENTFNDSSTWKTIVDSHPAPLIFDMETTARDKIRYDKSGSHFNTSHRIELALKGYGKCQPITVDKLGIFYRHLQTDKENINYLLNNHIRIIIEIVRQGSVQNKIIIRSPLQFTNALNIPLELKFSNESSAATYSVLSANTTIPIHLYAVMHNIQIRPVLLSTDKPGSPTTIDCLSHAPLEFSDNLFSWCTVKTCGQKIEAEVCCKVSKNSFYTDSAKNKAFLICTIECLNFPTVPKFLPGHIVTISAPLSVVNKLPCDLRFAMKSQSTEANLLIGRDALVRPSNQCTVLTASMRQSAYFSLYLDSFPRCDPLLIHGDVKLSHAVLIRLFDDHNRLLELEAKVDSRPCGPVTVTISAIYWIVNRTSLALVYAQSSEIDTLAAGQLPENEEACSSMPFPFNFSNKNDSYTFRVRLGSKAQLPIANQFKPLWSEKVSLEKIGTTTIQLRAASLDQKRPHLLYNIGLEIRPGRGKHRNTKMVILTARYLLDNRSSYSLHFKQNNCKDVQNKPIMALSDSFLTFHWPRDDLDQLLAVQKLDENNQVISKFSGGFQIDQCNSFHIYLRGVNNHPPSQLRVTVSLQGARYRVVFTDVDDLPSPYRLENLTSLQVFFYQNVSETSCRKHSVLPPKASIPYALDEPTIPPIINLCIEGGTQACYNINSVGVGENLYYDNFLYIEINNPFDHEADNVLVFDVPQNNRKVFLNTKSSVSRSQLWYYSEHNELFHEGSIAPHDPKQKLDRSAENHLLLDVDILAPCPSSGQKRMYRMILAKADPRRDKYQRWYFTDDNCLTNKLGMKCYTNAHCRMAAIFGGFESFDAYYPLLTYEHWLRPGSGEVLVCVVTDGPTRVLRLMDKGDESEQLLLAKKSAENDSAKYPIVEMKIEMKGFGFFLINHLPEELLYAVCNSIRIEWKRTPKKDALHVKIGEIQIDNQQLDTGYPCVMYEENKSDVSLSTKCAFCLKFEKELGHPFDVYVFSSIKMHIAPMCVILEEKMLLKTMQMFWSPLKETELLEEDFGSLQQQPHFDEGKKIYVGNLQLDTGIISLSVITAESLPSDLKQMKKLFPSLMSFTNAQITIDPYNRSHVFETGSLIAESVVIHYRNQLRSQAVKIFGSVDFLGNPIGFISDITTGMKRLYSDQDVYNMVKHFAHGIGDSTAKICSSASRVISEITMDPEHEENRQKIFENARISGSNTAQVAAGFRSFAYGIWGGVKSVPTQLNKGYKTEGPSGLFIGALKGIVGVVTKPVGGVLDLATGSATSFREIARSSKEGQPLRRYDPRCLSSSWKLLPFYTTYSNNLRRAPLSDLTQAQHLLAKFSDSSSVTETVVGFLIIQNSKESQLKVIVSDVSIHIVKTVSGESNLLKHYPLCRLDTPPITVHFDHRLHSPPFAKNSLYVNFNLMPDSSEQYQATPKPPFKCDTVMLAKQLVKLVCEAHCDFTERQMTYCPSTDRTRQS